MVDRLGSGALAILSIPASSPTEKQPIAHQGQAHSHNDGGNLLQSFEHLLTIDMGFKIMAFHGLSMDTKAGIFKEGA